MFWVYGFPLLLAVALGIAFRDRPVERIPVDVATDGPPAAAAAEALQAKLAADPRVEVDRRPRRPRRKRLRTGKTELVVVPTAEPPGCEYVLDPTRPESVLAEGGRRRRPGAGGGAGAGRAAGASARSTSRAAGTSTSWCPGCSGMNLMGGGLWGVGFVTVDMRVRKLLKRFLATPMRRARLPAQPDAQPAGVHGVGDRAPARVRAGWRSGCGCAGTCRRWWC